MARVINFSGGKTSAMMTILLEPTPDDIVLFTDTKREHPKSYKFLNDFEAYEGIKVHRATYTHKDFPGVEGFDALISYKKYLPNRTQRFCTEELIETAKKAAIYFFEQMNLQKKKLETLCGEMASFAPFPVGAKVQVFASILADSPPVLRHTGRIRTIKYNPITNRFEYTFNAKFHVGRIDPNTVVVKDFYKPIKG